MIHITRRETFNAAHRLYRPEWDDEKNLQVFGKCSNPNWHGHNYVLYVTVKGSIDHETMNVEVDFMKDRMASTENLAIAIWEQLEEGILNLGAQLHCVKVAET